MSSVADFGFPVAKRQRIDAESSGPQHRKARSSKFFSPFRTLGLVSPTIVPFSSVAVGKTTFQITTSVGRSLQTYDLRRGLNLVFLSSPQTPGNITATCAYRDRVFAAWGSVKSDHHGGLWVFKRGKLVGELESSGYEIRQIEKILVLGSWIVGYSTHSIEVWKSDTYERHTSIVPAGHAMSKATGIFSGGMCAIPTFLNKVFVGRYDGNIDVYNVSTGRLIHTIIASVASCGRVTTLEPAPALGLVAIAYANGSVVIFDIDQDKELLHLRLSQSSHAITSISFRTDGQGGGNDGRRDGIMATSSLESGDITLWDLNDGARVVGVLRGAHETSSQSSSTGITKVEFLTNQPVFITSGLDNALRSWIFDQTPFSPIPRILHQRSGHAAPVTTLQFLPAASDGSEAVGKWLLSAGHDRSLWAFSLRKDGQNSEISQGNVKSKAKKMGFVTENSGGVEDFKAPPIVAIACSLNRDGGMGGVGGPVWKNARTSNAEEASSTGWESIVTAHDGDKLARTWFWGRKKAGRWTFESGDHTPVTSVAITACGTFAVIGSAEGSIDMFNLQSGTHRQRFPPRTNPAQAKKLKIQNQGERVIGQADQRHFDAITGITVDNLNRYVISSSLDGSIIYWEFMTGRALEKLSLPGSAATAMRYNPTSGLMSLACDDLCIRVVDIETKRIVRELWGCVGQIYDHSFSHDGRWIVSSSMDSVIRVFDLATAQLVDAFKTATCTNLAFSATGEFLATAHAGNIGINIWSNKSLFLHIPSRSVDEEMGITDLSASADFHASSQLVTGDDLSDLDEDFEQMDESSDIDQLDKALLTLSLVPQARWQTLLNLEAIRQRNKPVEPPKQPEKAPFFLSSSLSNGKQQQNTDSTSTVDEKSITTLVERSRITKLLSHQSQLAKSPFSTLLLALSSSPKLDPAPFIMHLSSLPPSAADLEIRSLSVAEMPVFVRALTTQLKRNKDFELVNTWMSVFLKLHGDLLQEKEQEVLRKEVLDWRRTVLMEERRLAELVGYTKGVVEFLRSAR